MCVTGFDNTVSKYDEALEALPGEVLADDAGLLEGVPKLCMRIMCVDDIGDV